MQPSSWLPQLDRQVWILAAGRLLSQAGSGLTFFYLPIFFVNQVGLSSTAVGFALSSASISGVVGRILGGSMTDSTFWGRRRTLLLAVAVSAIAALIIAVANDFPSLVLANLVMGMGVGLYWPATESTVADLSTPAQRNEAYAVTRLADNVGLGLGVVIGGRLIAIANAYRALFIMDAISFLFFLVVVYFAIPESAQGSTRGHHGTQGWWLALQDHRLLIYIAVNIMITTYLAQLNTVLPLYLKNFAQQGAGFSETVISNLFTWNLILSVICQLPLARLLNRFSRARVLMVSACAWAMGFLLVGLIGTATSLSLLWAILALGVLAIATVIYAPAASSLVAGLAPASLRGVYLSINSLCWAVGFFIGPLIGGIALDQTAAVAHAYWVGLAGSVAIALLILKVLDPHLQAKEPQAPG
jgi:MFS family permease